MDDIFFIKSDDGYYGGHAGEGDDARVHWLPERKGAVVFRTERSAQARVDELGISDIAEIVGY